MIVSVATTLTKLGSDVGIVTNKDNEPLRFSNQINDEREIHHNRGRCHSFHWSAETNIALAVSQISEAFGGIDIVVDTFNMPEKNSLAKEDLQASFQKNFWPTIEMLQAVEPYLIGRQKGRVILLVEEHLTGFIARASLLNLKSEYASQLLENKVALNLLIAGSTENYLRQLFPNESTEKALEKMGIEKLTDPYKIANLVSFLAGPEANGLNGQVIKVD